jgi:hypothetical protein
VVRAVLWPPFARQQRRAHPSQPRPQPVQVLVLLLAAQLLAAAAARWRQ